MTRLNRVIRSSKQKHGIISTDKCQIHSIAYIGISIKDNTIILSERRNLGANTESMVSAKMGVNAAQTPEKS